MPRFMPKRRKVLARRRSHAEPLEARRLLSYFYPCPGPDSVTGNTLRHAVIDANANGEDNKIFLKAGRYELTIPNTNGVQENNAMTGDLDLTSAGHQIWIVGAGADKTTIDANGIDRILQVFPNVTLVLKKLTLTGGVARDAGGVAGVASPATQAIIDGEPALGGAVLSFGGSIETRNATFKCNTADARPFDSVTPWGGEDAQGGAIWTDAPLFMSKITMVYNKALAADGVYLLPPPAGAAQPNTDGYLSDGGDAAGGAVYCLAGMEMWKSTVQENLAQAGNGGDSTDTVLIGQPAGTGGTAMGGGIYAVSLCSVLSLIKSNKAIGGDGGDAEVLDNVTPDSTSGASAPVYTLQPGDGGNAFGGGLYILDQGGLDQTRVDCNKAIGGDGGVIVVPIITGAKTSAPAQIPFSAYGADGGDAMGGGIYFGGFELTIADDSYLTANSACGGQGTYGDITEDGGNGGIAAGGGLAAQTILFNAQTGALSVQPEEPSITFCNAYVSLNRALGGDSVADNGSIAAAAYGGGIAINPAIFEIIRASGTANATPGSIGPFATALKLDHTIVSFNTAQGGDGRNGVDSPISDARPGGDGSDALGGGIYMFGGCATFICSEASHNTAQGGDGGDGGDVTGMVPTDAGTTVAVPVPVAGQGGEGGSAYGGGVATLATDVTLTDFNVWCNAAIAGDGGDGGDSLINPGLGSQASAPNTAIFGIGGDGGDAGDAYGGGLWMTGLILEAPTSGPTDGAALASSACLTRVDIYANRAIGGDGGNGGLYGGDGGWGGDAEGGGIYSSNMDVKLTDTKVPKNKAIGGDGGNGTLGVPNYGYAGNGGSAFGGGVRVVPPGELTLQGCTAVYFNCVVAGDAGTGNYPGLDGDALYPDIDTQPNVL